MLPSLKEAYALMHPLQGASFLGTPLQGGILKPPALRVVDDLADFVCLYYLEVALHLTACHYPNFHS
jgi:hypothetical protein